jgi:hypothetical protein
MTPAIYPQTLPPSLETVFFKMVAMLRNLAFSLFIYIIIYLSYLIYIPYLLYLLYCTRFPTCIGGKPFPLAILAQTLSLILEKVFHLDGANLSIP